MSQREQIKEILKDGQKHCSAEIIEKVLCIDYRKRISEIREELKPESQTVESEPCRGACGRNHTSGLHRYWIIKTGQQSLI